MSPNVPTDLQALEDQLDAAGRDAHALVAGLTEERAAWRAEPGSWNVAECLDHLATANHVYVRAMEPPATRARQQRRLRRSPAAPGFIGRWFIRSLEPPVTRRMKAPGLIRPRTSPPLADSCASFLVSQQEVRTFLQASADLDLARIHFPNPFIPGVRFSLATGLHVIPAHERRHLWQAWRVREAAERATAR